MGDSQELNKLSVGTAARSFRNVEHDGKAGSKHHGSRRPKSDKKIRKIGKMSAGTA
jgi:hypothetical protein